jgi:hypothetical protein
MAEIDTVQNPGVLWQFSNAGWCFEFPESWTGNLQIRNCVEHESGVQEATSSDTDVFIGIYAQDCNGLFMWVADCDTKYQAAQLARYFKAAFLAEKPSLTEWVAVNRKRLAIEFHDAHGQQFHEWADFAEYRYRRACGEI